MLTNFQFGTVSLILLCLCKTSACRRSNIILNLSYSLYDINQRTQPHFVQKYKTIYIFKTSLILRRTFFLTHLVYLILISEPTSSSLYHLSRLHSQLAPWSPGSTHTCLPTWAVYQLSKDRLQCDLRTVKGKM